MSKLSKEKQIEVLTKTIEFIKENEHCRGYFLCFNISEAIVEVLNMESCPFMRANEIRKYIPIFSKNNATLACRDMKLRRPTTHESGGWWGQFEMDIRIKVIEWFINKIKES